jgi:hypothetical protein
MIPVLQKEKKDTIRLISEKQLGLMMMPSAKINKAVEDRMFQDRGIDRRVIDSIGRIQKILFMNSSLSR